MKKKKLSNYLELVLFTFPAFFSVLMVTNIPFLMNIYYSFFSWNGISKTMRYVGIDNFIKLFNDHKFFDSALFTFKFSIFYLIIVNVIAIVLATLLAEKTSVSNISRSFYFIPFIISLVAISLIWKFILGPGFEYLYQETGLVIFSLSWLGDSKLIFYTVIIITVWQNVGFYMIIYIAGLMGIPSSIIEAASIDGAGKFRTFMKMKLPLLMPSITICIFHSITYGFKLFDIILVLTKGGPGNASATIAYDIYKEAFASSKYGMATAKSLVFFVVVLVITLIQLNFFKKREVEF